ncbi:MAG TPA: hypothetical protein DDZ91_14085 [Firmicutes bacterium]|nr:hypothetical protein [Bacillota bacterium]
MSRRLLSYALLLPLMLLILSYPTSTADFEMEFFIPERVEIGLSTEFVDLGLPQGAYPGYFEKQNAVRVDFRCNILADWEVRIYASDFYDGAKTIPISRLQWKTESSAYRGMSPAGGYEILARRRDYPPKKAGFRYSKSISYRLELRGDESGGTYSAPVTYTLFVP